MIQKHMLRVASSSMYQLELELIQAHIILYEEPTTNAAVEVGKGRLCGLLSFSVTQE
jgi:hypothetical protein